LLNFSEQFQTQAKAFQDKTAFTYQGKKFYYKNLGEYSAILVKKFSEIFRENELFVVCLPNSPEKIISYIATFQIQRIPAPISVDVKL